MYDLQTVIWKEWRELLQSGNRRSLILSVLVAVFLLGVILPLQQRDGWLKGGALVIWTVAPVVLLTQVIADAIAGERERHTLETLLATRLSDRAILFGKILVPTLWAWTIIQLSMLVALIPVNISTARLEFYRLDMLLVGMMLSALTSLLFGSVGLLFSLRAPSVRQAQQYTGFLVLSLVFLPVGFIVLVKALPPQLQTMITEALISGSFAPLILFVLITLVLINMGLLWFIDQRFRRNRLILD